MFAFLFVVAVISLLLLIYPYLIYPAILKSLPKQKAGSTESSCEITKFSLLFCAYNESAALVDKCKNLSELKSRYPEIEVLAYDDCSADSTASILDGCPAIDLVIRGTDRHGKAYGMKRLVENSTGQALVFTDANVLLDMNALSELSELYQDSRIGGIAGTLSYEGESASQTARVGGLYWRLEERIKDLESLTGNMMGADGSIFSVRTDLYPSFPDDVLDDLTVSMNVVFQGKRLIHSRNVIAKEHLVEGSSDEVARKIRIGVRAFTTHRYLKPGLRTLSVLDKFKYTSHKVLRWFGGTSLLIFLLFMIAALASIHWWLPLVAVGLVVLSVALVRLVYPTLLGALAEVVLAIVATQIGVFEAMFGRRVSTWAPSASRNQ